MGPGPVCELSPCATRWAGHSVNRVRVHGGLGWGWRADFQKSPEGGREEARVNVWAGGQGWRHREGPDSGGRWGSCTRHEAGSPWGFAAGTLSIRLLFQMLSPA